MLRFCYGRLTMLGVADMDKRGVVGMMQELGLLVVVLPGHGEKFQLMNPVTGTVVGVFPFREDFAGGELGAKVAAFMAAPNDEDPGYSNWEMAAVAYNRVNELAPNRMSSFYLLTTQNQALNPEVYRGCLPIDMPIPDYSREA